MRNLAKAHGERQSVLAEVELRRDFATKRVVDEARAAVVTEIIAKLAGARLDGLRIARRFHQHLAHRLHVILVEIVVGEDGRIADGEDLDLDDMMIKGELHNDDRINIYTRQKNELKNYVKFRTSYKEEMLQELPVMQPKHKF